MKKLTIIVAAAVIAVGMAGFRREYVLRFRDATNLRVLQTERRDRVVVTGGMTHSGLTVTKATTSVSGRTVIVRVYIDQIRGRKGVGSYFVPLNLPPEADQIWFGDRPNATSVGTLLSVPVRLPMAQPEGTGAVIWQRK
jgi:hypothetical protein